MKLRLRYAALAAWAVMSGQVSAANFVFDVYVTGRSDESGTTTPDLYHFQQTFYVDFPAAPVQAFANPNYASLYTSASAVGFATKSPVFAETWAAAKGDIGEIVTTLDAVRQADFFYYDPRYYYTFDFAHFSSSATGSGSGWEIYLNGQIDQSNWVLDSQPEQFIGLDASVRPLDVHELALRMQGHNFDWSETGITYAPGGNTTFVSYFGSAALNASASVIPEPATWALMVAGVGLAGAGMRIKRQQSATT